MKLDTKELKRIAEDLDVHKVVDTIEHTRQNLEEAERDDLIQSKMLANTLSTYFKKIVNLIGKELSMRPEPTDN